MYCTKCGTKVEDHTKYCKKCGHEIYQKKRNNKLEEFNYNAVVEYIRNNILKIFVFICIVIIAFVGISIIKNTKTQVNKNQIAEDLVEYYSEKHGVAQKKYDIEEINVILRDKDNVEKTDYLQIEVISKGEGYQQNTYLDIDYRFFDKGGWELIDVDEIDKKKWGYEVDKQVGFVSDEEVRQDIEDNSNRFAYEAAEDFFALQGYYYDDFDELKLLDFKVLEKDLFISNDDSFTRLWHDYMEEKNGVETVSAIAEGTLCCRVIGESSFTTGLRNEKMSGSNYSPGKVQLDGNIYWYYVYAGDKTWRLMDGSALEHQATQ